MLRVETQPLGYSPCVYGERGELFYLILKGTCGVYLPNQEIQMVIQIARDF